MRISDISYCCYYYFSTNSWDNEKVISVNDFALKNQFNIKGPTIIPEIVW